MSSVLILTLLVGFVVKPAASQTNHTNNTYDGKAPKYVFLFIGDGMSYPQVSSAEMYLGKKNNPYSVSTEYLNFTKFPAAGSAQTFDETSFCPDSASTATSISTGFKTASSVINMDATGTKEYTPITEQLKAKGYKIGVVTTVTLNHATPAAFYAKEPSRNNYYQIGLELAKSGFDYFAGGDVDYRTDKNKDKTDLHTVIKENGYNIVKTKEEILALNSNSGKVVAINPESVGVGAMPYEIDRRPDQLSLADFVKKGIDVLDNKNGFFMMVEAGKIDWAGHANDSAASIHDTIQLSKAVDEAIKVYNKYPNDTLIIVTGDHETGGLTMGFAGTGYDTFFNKIDNVTMSYENFDKIISDYRSKTSTENAKLSDLYPEIRCAYGLVPNDKVILDVFPWYKDMVLTDYEVSRLEAALKQTMIAPKERKYTDDEKIMYGTYEPLSVTLSHILNNKAGIDYTSYSHTGIPVPVFATGTGHEIFNGYYDNTDLYRKMAAITGINK
jgi:alkaline phosphatase